MVTVAVTDSAPYHLIADAALTGGPFTVRRTRAGDAWAARGTASHSHPTGPAEGPVTLGMPRLRVGSPVA